MADRPYYLPVADEEDLFKAAHSQRLPVLLKGPTGCGKTRLVEAMAHDLDLPLVAVACHEDLTAADLCGRYLLEGGSTRWVDGPLTAAVRSGGICYLDEVVEARQDTTVVIHPLADHRRELALERLGETWLAPAACMLVLSFNPGYQSMVKDLKESTRQRLITIELGWPPADTEIQVVQHEGEIDEPMARALVTLGAALRELDQAVVREAPSTRTLVGAARLMAAGISPRVAARAAILDAMTDDRRVLAGLEEITSAIL